MSALWSQVSRIFWPYTESKRDNQQHYLWGGVGEGRPILMGMPRHQNCPRTRSICVDEKTGSRGKHRATSTSCKGSRNSLFWCHKAHWPVALLWSKHLNEHLLFVDVNKKHPAWSAKGAHFPNLPVTWLRQCLTWHCTIIIVNRDWLILDCNQQKTMFL